MPYGYVFNIFAMIEIWSCSGDETMKQALGFKITMLSQNRSVETPLKTWRFQLNVMPCALE
jgi:hypothetical protein